MLTGLIPWPTLVLHFCNYNRNNSATYLFLILFLATLSIMMTLTLNARACGFLYRSLWRLHLAEIHSGKISKLGILSPSPPRIRWYLKFIPRLLPPYLLCWRLFNLARFLLYGCCSVAENHCASSLHLSPQVISQIVLFAPDVW